MNKFKESLKAVEKNYKNIGRKLEFKDKIALAVYMAIQDIETQNSQEEFIKTEYMMNINKVICNYEELKPILTEYFEKKKRKEKWER